LKKSRTRDLFIFTPFAPIFTGKPIKCTAPKTGKHEDKVVHFEGLILCNGEDYRMTTQGNRNLQQRVTEHNAHLAERFDFYEFKKLPDMKLVRTPFCGPCLCKAILNPRSVEEDEDEEDLEQQLVELQERLKKRQRTM
jgi:hypothetical protein